MRYLLIIFHFAYTIYQYLGLISIIVCRFVVALRLTVEMSKHFFNKILAISSRIKQHAGTQWPYVYTKCFIWYNRWTVYVKTSLCRFSFGSRLRFFFYWKKIWEFNYIWSNRYLLFFFKLNANNGIGTVFPSFLLVRSLVFSNYICTSLLFWLYL